MDLISATKTKIYSVAAVHGRLLIKERLLKLQVSVKDSMCCLCNGPTTKTNVHLFVECTWITATRYGVNQ